MKYKGFIIFAVLVCTVVALLGVGALFRGGLDAPASSKNSGEQTLDAFESIDIDVKSADIILEEGEQFAITYRLHDQEKIKRLEVEDGTLHFDTSIDFKWKPTYDKWSITLTIPKGAPLHTLKLETVAGEIEIADRSFQQGYFETTAGEIVAKGLHCEKLTLKTVSEDVHLVNSEVIQEVDIQTVSGAIEALVPVSTIHAESVGAIYLNGEAQGRRLFLEGEGPTLRAKSVSGTIEINNATAV